MLATALRVIAEGGGKEEVINPVLPETPELVWGAIFFFALLILMYAVCLPPVRKAMRQRDEQVLADQEAAERAAQEGEQLRRDYDATLAEARAEAARIVEEARAEADARRADLIRAAEDEVGAQRAEAMAALDAERREALAGMAPQMAELAVDAASRVVQRPLDVSGNRAVVDTHIAGTD
jgi:F-type H+-transporting ATPase subunit b